MERCCAVIDIGKTNKKLLIYDETLKCIHSNHAAFEEYEDNGLILEDLDGITAWFWNALKAAAAEFPINAVSVATHGATAVCIDAEGNNAVPQIAYTFEPGREFHQEFYDTFGTARELQQITCTPELSSLVNLGKGIHFRNKEYPQQMAAVKHILNFPQYFGFLLTGNAAIEPTMTGCHTYLYDFHKRDWSSVANGLGICDHLPQEMLLSWDVLGTVQPAAAQRSGLSPDCLVTVGIHDSNSSLLPYLIQGADDFVLNSTGSWCVAMRPTDTIDFAPEELGGSVFYNLSPFNQPVKTAIIPAGMEFEAYTNLFKEYQPGFTIPTFNPECVRQIISKKELFFTPGALPGIGMFPEATMNIIYKGTVRPANSASLHEWGFSSDELISALNLSLAIQTSISLERAGAQNGTSIFIEGGFRRNDAYGRLLSALFPQSDICYTSIEEATSFGAALLGHSALEGITPEALNNRFDITSEQAPATDLPGLGEYADAYCKAVEAMC